MEKSNWTKNYLNVLFALIGIILILVLFYAVFLKCRYGSLGAAGTVGDSFGMLNAIFSGCAFAGLLVTLLMQRRDLKNQRKELKSQRKEFAMNRTTTVIYNQLERFENAVKEFKITIDTKDYIGNSALTKLDNLKSSEEHAEAIDKILTFKPFASELNQFAYAFHNSFIGSLYVILYSDLSVSDKNQLKDLYYVNVGNSYYHLFREIINVTQDYSEKTLSQANIPAIHQDWFWELESARAFLSPYIDFYNTIFTQDTMEHNLNKFHRCTGNFFKR